MGQLSVYLLTVAHAILYASRWIGKKSWDILISLPSLVKSLPQNWQKWNHEKKFVLFVIGMWFVSVMVVVGFLVGLNEILKGF